ncbi:hypothetical protein OXH62_24395 [Pseudomonas chlororaphis]|uniref:hypothetical protein n=1 Tax=Pseudomonas chlororaphis TaxID=587753 RepID=UPI0035D4D218
MKQLQIRKTATKKINIHNDISNTANHLRRRVEEMDATGNREGISLDITACLVLLAFTFESRLNYIGAQKVADWRERKPFERKLKSVLQALDLTPDFSKRPYSTIDQLKDFRDTIAHGQPVTIEVDETVFVDPGSAYDDVDLRGKWEDFVNTDFMRQCSEDIDEIWKEWRVIGEIQQHQTLTHGEYSFELIADHLDPV